MTTAIQALFADDTHDGSIWHAWPNGRLGLARHAPSRFFGAAAESTNDEAAVDTSASSIAAAADQKRYPALAFSCGALVVFDALQLWVEGDGVGAADWQRTAWHWRPHLLSGEWRAGDLALKLDAAMVNEEEALVRVRLVNHGATAFRGSLVARGDDVELNIGNHNRRCLAGRDLSHWLPHGQHAWQGETVTTTRWVNRISWFQPIWEGLVPDDEFQECLRAIPVHAAMAFALGDGWVTGEETAKGYTTWRADRVVELAPGASLEVQIAFTGSALGSKTLDEATASNLVKMATGRQQDTGWADLVEASKQLWIGRLEQAPKLSRPWPDAWLRHYYKAWVVPFYNLTPPTDFGHLDLKYPTVVCNRVANGGFTVAATWESSVGALLLSYLDPELGASIMEGIYSTAAPDGFIAEMIGGTRHTQLAYIEPVYCWACLQNGADIGFIERSWETMFRHFVYRMHHATYKHLGTPFLRNFTYNYYSGACMLALARKLERPASEIREIEDRLKDVEIVINAFWDDDIEAFRSQYDQKARQFLPGVDAESLITLGGAIRPDKVARFLKTVREKFLTEDGAIIAHPDAFPGSGFKKGNIAKTLLKCSNYFHLLPALQRLDPELARHVAEGTVGTILKDGDFYEQHLTSGKGLHNGPGTLFGAFGIIWPMMAVEGLCESVLLTPKR